MSRTVRCIPFCAYLLAVLLPVAAAAGPPTFTLDCGFFGPAVNPKPRPCANAANVSVRTSIYFETAQDTTTPNPDVNPNTLTATLQRQGGPIVPMLNTGQQFASGFTGSIAGPGFLESPAHWGVNIVPTTPLDPNSPYTVRLNGNATDGTPMTTRTWSFTTRRALGTETAQFNVDLASATVTWKGFWYSGIGKPDFDTSLAHDQSVLYDEIEQSRQAAPDLFSKQRDFPLLADYWTHQFFDGAPNIMREQETRQVTAINTGGGVTTLTIAALAEGSLFSIAPDRQANSRLYLEEDFIVPGPNVQVLVCDRTKCQQATVLAVNETLGTVTISVLTGTWTVQPPVFGGDNPDIPDQFPYAYTTLRRLSPAGTPVYYWTRLEHELDQHVITYNRQPHVNFFGSTDDLCKLHAGDGVGGVCPNAPKDWHEWDAFVQTVVLHLIDRYTNPAINPNANPSIPGHPVVDWYYAIANEPDLSIFWAGTVNEMLEYYDYTANAMLRAFEARGINTAGIKIGGVEIGLVNTAHPSSETPYLYHASPSANAPGASGVHEGNYVCENPSFNAKRAARINALCTAAPGNKGVPLDFVSIHTYSRSADAAARLIAARDNALAIDATYFANTAINSHETVPDWVPSKDPDSKEMYRWGGYFSSWGADYFRRLLSRAVPTSMSVDTRYANGEAVITTWPPHNNFSAGITSVGSNLYVDDDDNGTLDRIVAVVNPFFRVAELMARMPRVVAPFPTTITDAGVDIAGFRAVASDADWVLMYAHDRLDTGGRETGLWNVTLNLSNSRFPVVKVTEYRIDRTHPAKAALDTLGIIGANQMYGSAKAAQVDALAAADDLVRTGYNYVVAGAGGTVQLTKPVYAQGVVVLELSGRCGNGTLDADEQCDDGNNVAGDCCSPTCSLDANGSACDDFNACTGSDTCTAGVCQPGSCQNGVACTIPPCGAAGHCSVDMAGVCACR